MSRKTMDRVVRILQRKYPDFDLNDLDEVLRKRKNKKSIQDA